MKNCVIVMQNYNLNAKLLQGKRSDSPHIMSYRSIESTLHLSPIMAFFNHNRIVKILKISKPVIFLDLLQSSLITPKRFNKSLNQASPRLAQSGCRIDYQANALSNVKDRLFLTGS